MAKAFIYGQMVDNTKVNGRTTKWKVKVYLPGRMVENMSVNIQMIKSMDMENSFGLKGKCIKGIGKMEDSMESEFTLDQLKKNDKENGLKVKE